VTHLEVCSAVKIGDAENVKDDGRRKQDLEDGHRDTMSGSFLSGDEVIGSGEDGTRVVCNCGDDGGGGDIQTSTK
jgi:hypothetical protein